jgi:hypothetical protein
MEKVLGMLLACGAAAALLLPLLQGGAASWPWGVLSLLLLLLTWAAPRVLTPAVKGWFLLGHVMGYINTRIILAVVFFIFITPLALFFRLTGRDLLKLKRVHAPSYWIKQEKSYTPDMFKKQF